MTPHPTPGKAIRISPYSPNMDSNQLLEVCPVHVERAMKELILHKEIIFFFCFRPADRTGEDLDIIYARLKVTYLKSEISNVTTSFLKCDCSVDWNLRVVFLLTINVYANWPAPR